MLANNMYTIIFWQRKRSVQVVDIQLSIICDWRNKCPMLFQCYHYIEETSLVLHSWTEKKCFPMIFLVGTLLFLLMFAILIIIKSGSRMQHINVRFRNIPPDLGSMAPIPRIRWQHSPSFCQKRWETSKTGYPIWIQNPCIWIPFISRNFLTD